MAATIDGHDLHLSEAVVNNLAAALQGRLVRPADTGYDASRALWNGMIDRRPALIARCVDRTMWSPQ